MPTCSHYALGKSVPRIARLNRYVSLCSILGILLPLNLYGQEKVTGLLTGLRSFSADVHKRTELGDSIHHLEFSDDGKTLVAADEEDHIHLFDVRSNRKLGEFATPEFKGSRPSVSEIHFLKSNHFVVCWSNKAIAELKLDRGKLEAVKQIVPPDEIASSRTRISDDGTRMAMALQDYGDNGNLRFVIRLFDFKKLKPINEFKVDKYISTLAFNAENEVAFGFGEDVAVLDTKGKLKSPPIKIGYPVNKVTFVGKQLYVSERQDGGIDGANYTILNFDKNSESKRFQTSDFKFKVQHLEFIGSPDSRLVFMQGYGKYDHGGHGVGVFFLNGETGKSFGWENLRGLVNGEENPYFYSGEITFSPDGKTIAVGDNGRLCFFQVNYDKMTAHLPETGEQTKSKKVAKSKPAKTAPKPRKWRSSGGNFSVTATFVATKDGSVQLKKEDGELLSVSVNLLSEKDQNYIKRQKSK